MKGTGLLTATLLAIFWIFIPATSHASYRVTEAKITQLTLSNDFAPGTVFIKVTGTVTEAKAACATTSWSYVLVVDDSVTSKAMFAMLLSAKTSQASVKLHGSGDCRIGYGVESLFQIDLME